MHLKKKSSEKEGWCPKYTGHKQQAGSFLQKEGNERVGVAGYLLHRCVYNRFQPVNGGLFILLNCDFHCAFGIFQKVFGTLASVEGFNNFC